MEKMNCFAPVDEVEKQEIIKELTKNTAAFGIDLGTTNSAISVIPAGTHPVTITLKEGRTTMPSCVMWMGDDQFVVGKEAYDLRYAENCIYSVKRLMQDVGAMVTLKKDGAEKTMRPAEVSAEILKALVREAGDTYGAIKDVVVTVPAYFDINGKKATKEAVELAGLNLLGIIAEPTAASLCYELSPDDNGTKDILIYDLGGGTFDVSLVRIVDNDKFDQKALAEFYGIEDVPESEGGRTVSVICTDGDACLGGDDIDIELFKIIEERLRTEYGVKKIGREDRERIILSLEQFKKHGVQDMYSYNCTIGTKTFTLSITPQDFMNSLRPIYNKAKSIVDRVLRENSNVADSLVLVGGSTKNPFLVDMLHEDYPELYVNNAFPPDESVALGASVHAKEIKFGENAISIFDSLAIGIGIVGEDSVSTVIPKGSQYPVTKAMVFNNVVDNQEAIKLEIVQGNSKYVEESRALGELLIDNLPPAPAGKLQIIVELSINVNGILNCSTTIYDPITKSVPIRRQLELDLSKVENKTAKKLSRDEKLIKKWKKRAAELPKKQGDILLQMIEGYPDRYDKQAIMNFIRDSLDVGKGKE